MELKIIKTSYVLCKLLTIIAHIPILYVFYLLTSAVMQAFSFFPKSHSDQKTDPQTGRRGRKGLGREVVFWPEI
jgi:hypothetical protein